MAAVTSIQVSQRVSSLPVTGYRHATVEERPQHLVETQREPIARRFSPSSVAAVGIAFLAAGGLLAGFAVVTANAIEWGSQLIVNL
ncbi:hypothetical protein [Timonella sp. A28]|uniref:hypothetical protein n=1 Tax=Timonella sp. A28 TaxID=3442640 RepID=UPI003EB7963C